MEYTVRCTGCWKEVPENSLEYVPAWQFAACPPCRVELARLDAEENAAEPALFPLAKKPARMELPAIYWEKEVC